MRNRDQAQKLRDQEKSKNEQDTQKALADQGENKRLSESLTKLQEELQNTKLLLADETKTKEELEQELETLKATNAELNAQLVTKKK